MVLMAICLGCLDYVLEEGARWEWLSDETIRLCAWIAALAGVGFVVRSLTFSRPIVDLRAFANRNFALGCWFAFVSGVGIYGLIYLTPEFLGHVRGFIAWQIGVVLLWAGVLQLLLVPVYGFLASRIDLRLLLMIGLMCFAICMWLFLPIMNQWGWREMLPAWIFRGIALPFSIASGLTLTLGEIPPDRLKLASGLFALMRNLGGALGIAACATILNDRTNFHFLHIAEHLNTSNTALADWVHRMSDHYSHTATLKKLWDLAYREAQVQAFADTYFVLCVCFMLSALMVPLLRAVAAK
jgi:MFS transporter, DHA2 family, multidrug resistance protein